MPKGVRFVDHRFQNAVELYMQLRPGMKRARAEDDVRSYSLTRGIRETTRVLQAEAARMAAEDAAKEQAREADPNE